LPDTTEREIATRRMEARMRNRLVLDDFDYANFSLISLNYGGKIADFI
jgi:hypothetical protein